MRKSSEQQVFLLALFIIKGICERTTEKTKLVIKPGFSVTTSHFVYILVASSNTHTGRQTPPHILVAPQPQPLMQLMVTMWNTTQISHLITKNVCSSFKKIEKKTSYNYNYAKVN